MAAVLEVKYFNSIWLKKVIDTNATRADASPNPAYRKGIYPGSYPGGYNLLPSSGLPTWPSGGDGTQRITNDTGRNWEIEEARIRGGYNNSIMDLGVKAYLTDPVSETATTERTSSLIYSGIFNSRTGVNQTNQFPTGSDITKSADPHNGSIQRLFAEDNDLTIFQENKVSRALIDKDAIYSAEGSATITSTQLVIGQIIPYLGKYGISDNPESFAIFGYRKYFVDKYRGVVLRLSRDGITEISSYGMFDWFRDNLAAINHSNTVYTVSGETPSGGLSSSIILGTVANPYTGELPRLGSNVNIGGVSFDVYVKNSYRNAILPAGQDTIVEFNSPITIASSPSQAIFTIISRPRLPGGWDIHNRQYTISLQNQSNFLPLPFPGPDNNPNDIYGEPTSVVGYSTVTFDDSINGWVSFYGYNPSTMGSLKDKYYSFNDGKLWLHYHDTINRFGEQTNYQTFYGFHKESSITFIFNPSPSIVKNFLTVSYEGSNGWQGSVFESGFRGYELADPSNGNLFYKQYQDEALLIPSVKVGYSFADSIDSSGNIVYGTNPHYAGFTRKENKYVANLVNNSTVKPQEVIIGPSGVINNSTSGIKGYFATVKIATDITTNANGPKELYSVGSVYQPSSY